MMHAPVREGGTGLREGSPAIPAAEPREGLVFKIYRDIGLAAIASELQMPAGALEPELGDAVKRGTRYIDFLLKSHPAGLRAAS